MQGLLPLQLLFFQLQLDRALAGLHFPFLYFVEKSELALLYLLKDSSFSLMVSLKAVFIFTFNALVSISCFFITC